MIFKFLNNAINIVNASPVQLRSAKFNSLLCQEVELHYFKSQKKMWDIKCQSAATFHQRAQA